MTVLDSVPRGAAASAATCCEAPDGPAATDRVAPPIAPDASRLAPVFKALGDPVRLQMISMIAARPEVCVCEITPAFDLSSGTISYHLKTLREAGLVDCERRGTFVYYWVPPGALDGLSALVATWTSGAPNTAQRPSGT